MQAGDGVGVGVVRVGIGERLPGRLRGAREVDHLRGGAAATLGARIADITHDFASDAGTNTSAQISSIGRACAR